MMVAEPTGAMDGRVDKMGWADSGEAGSPYDAVAPLTPPAARGSNKRSRDEPEEFDTCSPLQDHQTDEQRSADSVCCSKETPKLTQSPPQKKRRIRKRTSVRHLESEVKESVRYTGFNSLERDADYIYRGWAYTPRNAEGITDEVQRSRIFALVKKLIDDETRKNECHILLKVIKDRYMDMNCWLSDKEFFEPYKGTIGSNRRSHFYSFSDPTSPLVSKSRPQLVESRIAKSNMYALGTCEKQLRVMPWFIEAYEKYSMI